MQTLNAAERILARLKAGLLIQLDRDSLNRTRQIVEEETGHTSAPAEQQDHFNNVPAPAAPTPTVAAHQQAFNDAIEAHKAEHAEALRKTAAGEGMSWDGDPTKDPMIQTGSSAPFIEAEFTEASAPADSVAQESSDAKG
jgi:hypothetical protein